MSEHQAPRRFDDRWRLSRAGIVNVWHYLENTFELPGGRMILRGTNGSGKSRALEMLLPFLLDGDRRRMDATGAGRVNLDELMRTGADGQTNRTGYIWLELERPDEFLTIGALIRHSQSAKTVQVWYFTTPLRVGHDFHLMSPDREPLAREELVQLIGTERLTDSADKHRDRIRAEVFELTGDAGRDRYQGLLQLLHTLRSPDVGNRIDEGQLPQILLDSLPPLGEQALARAGEQLDSLTNTREAQQRLEVSAEHVDTFLAVYRRYACDTLLDTGRTTIASADTFDAATRDSERAAKEHADLQQQLAECQATEAQLRSALQELDNAIRGIQAREIFKTADDLVQRDRAVRALEQTVDQALAGADRERANHARAVRDSDQRLTDVAELVDDAASALSTARAFLRDSGLPDGGLPSDLRAVVSPRQLAPAVVRVGRNDDPTTVERPITATIEILPGDLVKLTTTTLSAARAASERLALAERRLAETVRLATEERRVHTLEADAERIRERATADADEAGSSATRRDTAAVELAMAWHRWTSDVATVELLNSPDWTAFAEVAPLLVDLESLTGDVDEAVSGLDLVVEQAARPARGAVAADRARLDADDAAAAKIEVELGRERDDLRQQRDAPPAQPTWLAPDRPGDPLWRCLDFREHVPTSDRAGIEGALLAAGLLSATVQADGSVRAEDGQLILVAPAARPARSLGQVLQPDPSWPVPASVIVDILAGIGLDDDEATTSVAADGSWRNGPLHGRHQPPTAQHIGAAARAEARRTRIAEIDDELAALAEEAGRRGERRAALAAQETRLDRHLATAPHTAELNTARQLARAAVARAAQSRSRAEQELRLAADTRQRWAAQLQTHRLTCEHHGLPSEAPELQAVVGAARSAADRCSDLQSSTTKLIRSLDRHRASVQLTEEAEVRRDEAEQTALHHWLGWHDLAGEVAALHAAVDLTLEDARRELARSEHARGETGDKLARAARVASELGPRVGSAEAESKNAAQRVTQVRDDMIDAAQRFNRRIALAGLAAAATSAALVPVERPEQSDSVRTAVDHLTGRVQAPRLPASANAVLSAFQTFDREVSGQLDVRHTIDDDVHLVQVAGIGAERTLAGAAATLAERVAAGQQALSEREREVFTTFVLGGVAEELRRRVNQADQLVKAMNASLRSIRTTNGIGVSLGWRLLGEHVALHRILELVATADAVRTAAQNAELTDLLRNRVDEFYAAEPTTGYAGHLAAALDYRRWHEVTVTILGPEEGQRRHLSRRAKLSQGETRFVSYVALFAAADAYLTSLGDNGRALRLILLDDAFAKVDDTTVAELMGMLVKLDLDFVMTGHALWGCFAQVPSLDIYEVRRSNGSSAVTTRVHWDGHTRVLRSTA